MESQLHVRIDETIEELRIELLQKSSQWSTTRTPSSLFDAEEELQIMLIGAVVEAIHQDASFVAECQLQALRDRGACRHEWRQVSLRTLGGRRIRIKTPYSKLPRKLQEELEDKIEVSKTGVYPVLRRLGIIKGDTPRFLAEVNRQMIDGPSGAEAQERLSSRGIAYAQDSLWRLVHDLGSIALWQRQVALKDSDKINVIEPAPLARKRVVVSLDGGRIHLRLDKNGEHKKRCFATNQCEPKLFVIYTIDDQGNRERKRNAEYDSTIQSVGCLFDLLKLRLKQLGITQAAKLVILGDGSSWIWKGAAELRADLGLEETRVIEILDWAHVAEKLSEATKLQIKEYPQQQDWFKRLRKLLKAGEIDQVIAALVALGEGKREQEELHKVIEYLQTHRSRMRYDQYQAEGLPIGSGVIESGVRRIVNLRLKGAGIFWKPENAEATLHLRCQVKSGKWVAFIKEVLSQWASDMSISLEEARQIRKQIAASFVESQPSFVKADSRNEAIQWARNLLKTDDALIIDTETTGLGDDAEVIQLAILDLKGRTLFDELFKSFVPITPEAHAKHGITNEDLQNVPGFVDLYSKLASLIRNKKLIAYNAEFDRRVLMQTCHRFEVPMPESVSWECAMQKYAVFWADSHNMQTPKWQSLEAACIQQGISIGGSHRAARDSQLTLELIKALSVADK